MLQANRTQLRAITPVSKPSSEENVLSAIVYVLNVESPIQWHSMAPMLLLRPRWLHSTARSEAL
jgi:hypothetical protein